MKISITAHPRELARLNENLNELARETSKTLKEVLIPQMRLLATDLAYVTAPKGKSNEKGTKKVMRRISSIYPPPGSVVKLLKKKNSGVAGKFASYITSRKTAAAQKILNQYLPELNIKIGSFDGGALHKSQRDHTRITDRLLVVGYTRVTSYAKKTARKVGFSKGGFATASRQLGGVRGIPGWATRQAAPGTGSVTGDGKTLAVTITNGVKYIRESLKPADEAQAINHRRRQVESVFYTIQNRKIQKAIRKT